MAAKPVAAPVSPGQRITLLDSLRGFALLGILVMNIQSFAMIGAAYAIPSLHMDLSGVNWWIWALGHMFADMKFMALFSMLFGAGIIVLTRSREDRGVPTMGLHYRRSFWLLIFGLIHAYYIWYGDILVTYALAAMVVYWVRNRSVPALLVLGALALCLAPALGLLAALAPPELQQEVAAGFIPSPEEIAAEIQAYLGSWSEVHAARVEAAADMHANAVPFYLFWRASGLMLIGMALFKLGILSGNRTAGFYNRMIAIGLAIGLPLVVLSVIRNSAADWHPLYSQLGVGHLFNYFGSLAMAIAYVGVIMRLGQTEGLKGLQDRLSAVGRMAFTNYIMQSVICTALFYGFGLGLFGSVERWGQMLIVVAVWAVQLVLSPLWLARYRFGPLEWAWRSLTYWRLQPMRL